MHGAGYYLVAQFFSATANLRTDEYGGSAENRARFACNIIRKIKARCGADFPVLIKMNVIDGGLNGGVSVMVGFVELLSWCSRPARMRSRSSPATGAMWRR